MVSRITYTNLRKNLVSVLDRVTNDQEVVVVRRRGAEDVALIPAGELNGLMETAHLLGSPQNARRLLSALNRAKKGLGRKATPDRIRREFNLNRER